MKYEYWFAGLKGIPGIDKMWIRSKVSSAKELFYINEEKLISMGIFEKFREKILHHASEREIEELYEKVKRKNVNFVTVLDDTYPERLRRISAPPYAIYFKGKLPEEKRLSISIVGARECSAYGEAMAIEYGKELARNGVQIISGMARGIDGFGQWSALEAGGTSYAVLGCGPDICYPRENYKLYERLNVQGGILSEYPVGVEPLRQHFPARNRIISGLSDVILVMEAKEKSGSLITADMALEQGKDVYALPGLVTSKLSAGCHQLIKQGAGILTSPKELLEDLDILGKMLDEKQIENKIVLENEENIVYSCLDFQPKNPGLLSTITSLPIQNIMAILVGLEMKGYVREVSKNYYVKVK